MKYKRALGTLPLWKRKERGEVEFKEYNAFFARTNAMVIRLKDDNNHRLFYYYKKEQGDRARAIQELIDAYKKHKWEINDND